MRRSEVQRCLSLRDVPEPHAGLGEVRVRVAAVGLNAMDPAFVATPELAARFNLSFPCGFGYDFAGVIDEVGDEVSEFRVGDRVYGGVLERAAADFVVNQARWVRTACPYARRSQWMRSPARCSWRARQRPPHSRVLDLTDEDTVLIGGAAGGVGVFAVQLARLTGATVIGTASEGTFPFLANLGAVPVALRRGTPGSCEAGRPRRHHGSG